MGEHSIPLGTLVRVLGTPETLAAELAGLVGQVREVAASAGDQLDGIGTRPGSGALLVEFPEPHSATWISPYLLEIVADGKRASSAASPDQARSPGQATEFRALPMGRIRAWSSALLARCLRWGRWGTPARS